MRMPDTRHSSSPTALRLAMLCVGVSVSVSTLLLSAAAHTPKQHNNGKVNNLKGRDAYYFYGYDNVSGKPTTGSDGITQLPDGLVRSPPLHEHSFGSPIVADWWDEGVPHFVLSGGALASEEFIRLAPAGALGARGFAFNTVPCDHKSWEVRLRFSIRTPLPIARARAMEKRRKGNEAGNGEGGEEEKEEESYQGGDGMALWYIERPIGDNNQHVPKHAKAKEDQKEEEDPSDPLDPRRVADLLHNTTESDDDDDDDDDDEGVVNETKREERHAERLKRQKEREELYSRFLKRGTSQNESDLEPRVFGLKFSDFKGFGVLIDSIGRTEGYEDGNGGEDKTGRDKKKHVKHEPKITLLLNLPGSEAEGGRPPTVNNFDPTQPDFRVSPVRLQCNYDFRQAPTPHAIMMGLNHQNIKEQKGTQRSQHKQRVEEEEEILRRTPEEPVELLVRYYDGKLRVALRRENISLRRVVFTAPPQPKARHLPQSSNYYIEHSYDETLCGELSGVKLPLMYHFGVSVSTGRRPHHSNSRKRSHSPNAPRGPLAALMANDGTAVDELAHVDVHEAMSFELRELAHDAEAMSHGKHAAMEHFDYETDQKEREEYSRGLHGGGGSVENEGNTEVKEKQ
ncbi:hypothetical protein, conserved [Trypanosoma brucei gambiense DAL972]|uniref:Uncharacterized protein n=2 Tax=Trypanosoma brucei TaxID=5691 RepID=Q57XR2_TRYB2|nr:hypothetical protein, conserved [Trypanosoma brucei gambiense DAL972]XP_846312.1 hypothetical protein, conserved [Trypanosoma brucei brucei TREU927]AAX69606.1 hypothetical protein, conserved [Trypanosoma brucei]AAZ12753.1 hypothetical protein, conserved [Trypanosoma brucei brucei TREU927]CBH12953.1 hypothetical protein, conserved [Trypanosoma brucei gambiense DAL972]|eukprot:XP_011775232.1 hypothetical protein, conserved [Trypanosoma brucei gambiense DAL972]